MRGRRRGQGGVTHRVGYQTGLIRDELRDMRELRDFNCFEEHESIVRVSANQTANFGKVAPGLAELAPGLFSPLGNIGREYRNCALGCSALEAPAAQRLSLPCEGGIGICRLISQSGRRGLFGCSLNFPRRRGILCPMTSITS